MTNTARVRTHYGGRALLLAALVIGIVSRNGWSATVPSTALETLADAEFSNLTPAERSLLRFAGSYRSEPGGFAAAGPSANPDDPTNDRTHADRWGKEREVRAELIRWLCVDPQAKALIDPQGIRVLGARIAGQLDLVNAHVPFGLTLRQCAIPKPMNLSHAEVGNLDFGGSYVNEIRADGIEVHGDLDMNAGFSASGWVQLDDARIDGNLNCAGGSFTHSKGSESSFWAPQMPALSLDGIRIAGLSLLCCGFHSNGGVMLSEANLRDLECFGGRFINPGKYALIVNGTFISGYAVLGGWAGFGKNWGGIEADGQVSFIGTKLGAFFRADGARFLGKPTEPHGLIAVNMSAEGGIIWLDAELQNGGILDLRGASTGAFIDNEGSWPQPGNLFINGFTYRALLDGYDKPSDARSRLRWIGLQSAFNPQPYRQLAALLQSSGDNAGAVRVLIEEQDLRYARYGTLGRLWGGFLKWTIGYGHRPLLTILWSFAVVMIGWPIVWAAKRAGVMRPTFPENIPQASEPDYEELHPLLYSVDAFLPFVNLHQEHYWWPNSKAAGECAILGYRFKLRGSLVRHYLWLQIFSGWLLSAILIAGVTGLMRND